MIRIDKERTWIFSPVNNIVIKTEITGNIKEKQLIAAINNTVNQYEMLHQKIVLDKEGNAFYEKSKDFEPTIKIYKNDWMKVAREQEKLPLAINQGEFIRFFYNITETGIALLIIAHHIAGDGISFTYLLQDIIKSLNGEKIEYKKLSLFSMESLPKASKLKAPTSWLLKSMNKKWRKTGKKFEFNDYYSMYDKYWNNRDTFINTRCLEKEVYDAVNQYSKENNVTINSLITTAFIRASEELSDVGMAASIRDKGYTGMGNYATGISIKYQYNEKQSFIDNARNVQKLIYDKLNKESKKYFLLQFMGNIEPTLIDAVYFEACGVYDNKIAKMFSNMFGYSGNPKGIRITNLTKIPIETRYGSYELTDFIFVPPLVLNAKRIIGIASFGNKITFSLHLNNDNQAQEHQKFFDKGIKYLENLK